MNHKQLIDVFILGSEVCGAREKGGMIENAISFTITSTGYHNLIQLWELI